MLADLESQLHQPDTQTKRNIHDLMVNRENQDTEAEHKDIDINSKSTAKIKPAGVGISLLRIMFEIIILLIICTYPLEKHQITKYRQKNDLFSS